MNNSIRNVRVFAIPVANYGGIDIYLDFSGQKEYLMTYRFNGPLYRLLKDGICLNELERTAFCRAETRGKNVLIHSARQLLRVTEDYLKYEYLPYKNVG